MSGRYVDVVLIARDLMRRYPALSGHLKHCHPELSSARTELPPVAIEIVGNNPTVGVIAIARAEAAKQAGVENYPIFIKALTPEDIAAEPGLNPYDESGQPIPFDRVMRSILRFSSNCADVDFLSTLNVCWRRFVVCKELCHIITGETGHFTGSVSEQLDTAFQIGTNLDLTLELSREMFAWFLAVELMLPWEARRYLIANAEATEDRIDLARLFWIPKSVIDMYFETKFAAVSRMAHLKLGAIPHLSIVNQ